MGTFMMVKAKEFRALVDYYKGKITGSSLLDKAAHIPREAHLLVEDETTPSALKQPVVKELMLTECDLALSLFLLLFLFFLFLFLSCSCLVLVLVPVLVFFSFALTCCTLSHLTPFQIESRERMRKQYKQRGKNSTIAEKSVS